MKKNGIWICELAPLQVRIFFHFMVFKQPLWPFYLNQWLFLNNWLQNNPNSWKNHKIWHFWPLDFKFGLWSFFGLFKVHWVEITYIWVKITYFWHWNSFHSKSKGQLISKCPYEKSVSSKIPTKIFLEYCPGIFCSFLGASWKLFLALWGLSK